jgi:hypothetical protein
VNGVGNYLVDNFDVILLGDSQFVQSPYAPYHSNYYLLPTDGHYLFKVSGWRCGIGNGGVSTQLNRGGFTIYSRNTANAFADCAINTSEFLFTNCVAGDQVSFFKNDNNTGTSITSLFEPARLDERGAIQIWYIVPM